MSKAGKDRPRLGRGLSSLIPTVDFGASETETPAPPLAAADEDSIVASVATPEATAPPPKFGMIEIPVAKVIPNPHQPRRAFSETTLGELAASIKSTGLIQPIIVRPAGDQYELIAGERRWRAATLAGLEVIPAILRDVDGFAQAQMALVENIQREDLNPIDRARAYHALVTQLGLTQQELAGRLGEDRSSIANHLRLLDLTPSVQSIVAAGGVTLGHAKILAGIAGAAEQERYAQLVLTQGLSVRNLEKVVEGEKGKTEPVAPPPAPLSGAAAHVPDLEKSLTRQLGLRVQLRPAGKKGKGRLIVHYASLDEFDELMSRMGVRVEP